MENIIEIKNLKKVFGNGVTENVALQDINLEIKQGEIFGIIGLSGAGKSTLVRMMNYLEKPTEGKVLYLGKDLGTLKIDELRSVRKNIGMIFQGFNLLSQKSVIKNVLFPFEISGVDKKKAKEKARELLKLVDLANKENEYPSKLSGGQKQRVAIARALAMNPKVILCDEATSALDPKTTIQILDLLKKINKEMNVTIVIITHQMNVIENICDRVAIIDGGKIVEEGNVKDVFRNPKSDIGRKLILGANDNKEVDFRVPPGVKCLRLAFDGSTTTEPIVSAMSLHIGVPINILFANAKKIDLKYYGQMVIELPNDFKLQNEIKNFLTDKKVTYWEVE